LGVDVTKDLRTWMKGRSWDDAVAAGRDGELVEYVLRDAKTCLALWTRHAHRWPDDERELAHLTMVSGWRGVAIDLDRADAAAQALERTMWEARNLLPWADGDSAVLSIKSLGQYCREAGIAPPVSTAEDDPACAEWERVHGDKYPWVAAMRTYRKSNALREKVRVMTGRVRPDGTMGIGMKYFGAHTGRWSGDSGFNCQNLPRAESHGADLRACLVPRPGKQFVICDLSQIEPRVLAWMCGDQLLLDQLAQGVPIYEAHARSTMGWTGGSLKKENSEIYGLAKARVLGLGYGCGAGRFVEVARNMAGIVITPHQAARTVDSFRASNRKILGLWNRLQNDFRRSNGGDFVVELPSGRKLTYREVRSAGGWTARIVRGGPRVSIYGGRLTENCIQSTARDVFAECLLRLHRAGVDVVFHVHDEAVCEVDLGTDPREIERLMSITPDWLPGCPLAAEAVVANHYCK
jgi:DNA polymerase